MAWNEVTSVFSQNEARFALVYMTPAGISNETASYKGMGTFLFHPLGGISLISTNLNGGYGSYQPNFEAEPEAEDNYLNYSLFTADDNSFYFGHNDQEDTYFQSSYSSYDASRYFNDTWSLIPSIFQYDTSWQIDALFSLGGSSFTDSEWRAYDSGFFGPSDWVDSKSSFVADPVNPLTGEFYIDAVDLSLPGPMPLQIRRNYLTKIVRKTSSASAGNGASPPTWS